MPEEPEQDGYEPPDPDETWFKIPVVGTIGLFLDILIQVVWPHARRVVNAAQGCVFHDFGEIPAGKRARIRIKGNEATPPNYGAVEIFVVPQGAPIPPAPGAPGPRVTFGGDGETTANGPGRLIIHQTTNVPATPKIRVSIED